MRKKSVFRLLGLFVLVFTGFVSCNLSDLKQNQIHVQSILVEKQEITIGPGQNEQIKYTVLPENAPNKNVSFVSADSSIAIVSEGGLVTGLEEGQTLIFLTSEDLQRANFVKVIVDSALAEKITVTFDFQIEGKEKQITEYDFGSTIEAAPEVPEKEGFTFTGWFINPEGTGVPVQFPYVLNDPQNKAPFFYACFRDNSQPVIEVESVTVTPSALELNVGDKAALKAEVNPEDATDKSVTWESENTAIVTVDSNGNVKAVGEGSTAIVCTTKSGGKTARVEVTVGKGSVIPGDEITGITLPFPSLTMEVGDSTVLFPTVEPEVSNPLLIWESSDSATVEVDSTGKITGKKAGSANIKVSSATNPAVNASCFVTVKEKFEGIKIYVAKALNYSQIYYWNCDNELYTKPAWPGVPMEEEGEDYVFVFEDSTSVEFLITNSAGGKLYASDMSANSSGEYRVTASGVEPITEQGITVSISPTGERVSAKGKIKISFVVPSGKALASLDCQVACGSTRKTYGLADLTGDGLEIRVSDFASGADQNISVNLAYSDGENNSLKSWNFVTFEAVAANGDWNNLRIYQVMVSSYADGDSSIGYQYGYGPGPHNGDLQGIINSLDYIQSLGMNALWMTPVFNSSGDANDNIYLDSTGYYTRDYFDIDPNFGTKEKLRELVDACHERGMYVILDGVFGHWGDSVVTSPSGKVPQRSYGMYKACDYPESLDFFTEVAQYWIREFKIDGWRLDQCYQVGLGENANGDGDNCFTHGHNYWYEIRTAVEEAAGANKAAGEEWGTLGYMVGEHWRGDASLIQRGSVDPGVNGEGYGLRSCFDFPSRYNLVKSFAIQESTDESNASDLSLGEALDSTYQTWEEKGYEHPDGYYPNLFLTNHDLVRFGNLINWKFGEDRSDANYWKRHKIALTAIAMYTGPITLYYGDEYGMMLDGYTGPGSGGYYNDNMARDRGKTSGFDANEQDLVDYVAKLMDLREKNPVLSNGTHTTLVKETDFFVGEKEYEGTTVVFMINNNCSADKTYNLGQTGTNMMTGESVSGSVTVPPLSAVIVKL